MDEKSSDWKSRRSLIKGAALLAGAAIIPLLANADRAFSAAKLSKTAVKYQDEPKSGKE
jgi:hypothetical protein